SCNASVLRQNSIRMPNSGYRLALTPGLESCWSWKWLESYVASTCPWAVPDWWLRGKREKNPIQQTLYDRPGARVHRPSPCQPASGRRRCIHKEMPCLAGAADGLRQSLADRFVHGGAGNGGDPGRYPAV